MCLINGHMRNVVMHNIFGSCRSTVSIHRYLKENNEIGWADLNWYYWCDEHDALAIAQKANAPIRSAK